MENGRKGPLVLWMGIVGRWSKCRPRPFCEVGQGMDGVSVVGLQAGLAIEWHTDRRHQPDWKSTNQQSWTRLTIATTLNPPYRVIEHTTNDSNGL